MRFCTLCMAMHAALGVAALGSGSGDFLRLFYLPTLRIFGCYHLDYY